MGTGSGDIDPGLVSFLARSEQMTALQYDHMVNHESGLLGVSEISSGLRDRLTQEARDVQAVEDWMIANLVRRLLGLGLKKEI